MSFSQWQLSHISHHATPRLLFSKNWATKSDCSGEPLEAQFLFQRVSVLVQRFIAILFQETFQDEDDTDT